MSQLHLLRDILEKNSVVLSSFEDLVAASILMGYSVIVKEISHKKYIYYAVNFVKYNKEVHLDFSFTKNKNLVSICTCIGDCKPISYSSSPVDFIKTINRFKDLILF
jgi:hypothetical protein